MSVYVTGDMHAQFDMRKQIFETLTKDDILLVLGDFGFSWNSQTERDWLLKKYPFTTISVLGNHENYNRIIQYPQIKLYDANLRQMDDKTYYVENGEVLNIDGNKLFCFGGAMSIDKQYRTPYKSWWPEEIPSYMEYDHALITLAENNFKFDYILSHTCSLTLAQRIYQYNIDDPVEKMLDDMDSLITKNNGGYKYQYFGHHHKYINDGKHIGLYREVVRLGECIPIKRTLDFDIAQIKEGKEIEVIE